MGIDRDLVRVGFEDTERSGLIAMLIDREQQGARLVGLCRGTQVLESGEDLVTTSVGGDEGGKNAGGVLSCFA